MIANLNTRYLADQSAGDTEANRETWLHPQAAEVFTRLVTAAAGFHFASEQAVKQTIVSNLPLASVTIMEEKAKVTIAEYLKLFQEIETELQHAFTPTIIDGILQLNDLETQLEDVELTDDLATDLQVQADTTYQALMKLLAD